jgi:ubiquinone/menaquinone biosynthesis C-methylase UbiE
VSTRFFSGVKLGLSTKDVFDKLYRRYDLWYEKHPVTAWNELMTVRAAVEGVRREKCLEIGVGTGWFASKVGCWYGVDPSIRMLEVARLRGVEVVAGRGEMLPFRDESFHATLLVVTLCFVDDPQKTILEAYRVTVPGGFSVSCIVPRDSMWGQYYTELAKQGHPFYTYARFYTVEEVESMLENTGFRVESIVSTLTYPPGEDVYEEPRSYTGREGFACIKAVKQ